MAELENTFLPDAVVGNWRNDDLIIAPSSLAGEAFARTARLDELSDDGYSEISALSCVNVVSLDSPADLSGVANETDGVFYVVAGDQLNAVSRRIANVKSPILSGDLASKEYADQQASNDAEGNQQFGISTKAPTDQVNFFHWGTFRIADSVFGIQGERCAINSIVFVCHGQQWFNGIIDAYLGIYKYIDDSTEPGPDDLIARSSNSFDVPPGAFDAAGNYKYVFSEPVELKADEKYVFRFTNAGNERPDHEQVDQAPLDTDFSPYPRGSFKVTDSDRHVIHFGRVLRGAETLSYEPDIQLPQQICFVAVVASAPPRNNVRAVDLLEFVDKQTGRRVAAEIENGQWKFKSQD